jgi:glycosyltransferase involved in cell wall biosynthesis
VTPQLSRPQEVWIHALGAKAGGGLTYLQAGIPELARQVDPDGTRIVLLASAPLPGDVPAGVEVRVVSKWATSALRRLVFDQIVLPMWLYRRKPSAVYFTGNFSAVAHRRRAIVLLRNTIYFDREFLTRRPPGVRAALYAQRVLAIAGASRASVVLYPTNAMRSLVERTAPWLARRGEVVSFGVREDLLASRRREAEGPSSATPRFVLVANYTFQKNITVVLRALALAASEGVPVRVTITSTLEGGPAGSAGTDRALIARHGLIERGFLELVGPTYGDELIELYSTADACLMPSFTESFGHPIVEAMALGKPLVCADRPFARELCGAHAVYFDPDDPAELVGLWRSWGQAPPPAPPPPEWIRRRFSWADHCRRLLELLVPKAGAANGMD